MNSLAKTVHNSAARQPLLTFLVLFNGLLEISGATEINNCEYPNLSTCMASATAGPTMCEQANNTCRCSRARAQISCVETFCPEATSSIQYEILGQSTYSYCGPTQTSDVQSKATLNKPIKLKVTAGNSAISVVGGATGFLVGLVLGAAGVLF